jgi:hypothetical protein
MKTLALFALLSVPALQEPEASSGPAEGAVPLFNGKDFGGLTTWLKDSGREDPRKVFSVHDGMIHASGDGMGYVATAKAYRDYKVVVEYKWGTRTDGGRYVRNSGLLIHAGRDGEAGKGAWAPSIEVQLAQGCEGDLIGIRGKDPLTMTVETVPGPDKRPRWKKGGTPTLYSGKQFWWSNHDPDFKELLDTRGKNDVASPTGEWTRVEVVCEGKRVAVSVNGVQVNEATEVSPASGRILLQCEGHEVFFRKFELHPLPEKKP